MEISSEFVGRKLKRFSTQAEKRFTTNYAAAIGDFNPRYFDDESEQMLVAHPMFAVGLSWPIIANISDYIDFKDAAAFLFSIVHYTEFIKFHRPVKPGEKLEAQGDVAAILPRRGGTHVIFRFPFTDKNGEPVFTEFLGGLLRGVSCPDGGRGSENLPKIPSFPDAGNHSAIESSRSDISSAAPPLWEAAEYISPGAPYIYDACSDIVFAIHTSPAFARSVGLPGIILQGTATLALAVKRIIRREADDKPELLSQIGCRFRAMVFPGEEIKIRLLNRRNTDTGKELFFDVLNGRNETAIKEGFAKISF